MARKMKTCVECDQPPFRGGLCEEHHAKSDAKQRRETDALEFLHHGRIDGKHLTDGPFFDESLRLREWWSGVCAAVTGKYEHPVLKDHTQFGMPWCIGIAVEIIDSERDRRAGLTSSDEPYRAERKRQLWQRLQRA